MTTPVVNEGGGRGRRTVARLALFSGLVLALGVALSLVEVGVSLRWKSGSGTGSGSGSGVFATPNNSHDAGATTTNNNNKDGKIGTSVDGVDLNPPDAPWVGSGKRAYAVVFPDVQDPLVLERALILWRSLEALKGEREDVVAIVPRYLGRQLLTPLVDIGYRVLPRDSPAPPWRATGRFVQIGVTTVGAGWGSGGGGGGGGGGYGWNLLALEALALTEYEEIVVLDQKVVLFEADESLKSEIKSGGSGGGESRDADSDPTGGMEENEGGQAGEMRGSEQGGGHRRMPGTSSVDDGGGDDGRVELGEMQESGTAATAGRLRLPPLVPQAEGWAVAFAPGDASALPAGPGLSSLPGHQHSQFVGQHPAIMVVRSDSELYEAIADLLCKGDALFSETYTGLPAETYMERMARDKIWERRALTAPLLHLAVARVSSLGENDFVEGGAAAKLPLKFCGGGETFHWAGSVTADRAEEGEAATVRSWTGATSPVVWCPLSSSQQQQQQQRRERRSRRLHDPDRDIVQDDTANLEVGEGSAGIGILSRSRRWDADGVGGNLGDAGLWLDPELQQRWDMGWWHRVSPNELQGAPRAADAIDPGGNGGSGGAAVVASVAAATLGEFSGDHRRLADSERSKNASPRSMAFPRKEDQRRGVYRSKRRRAEERGASEVAGAEREGEAPDGQQVGGDGHGAKAEGDQGPGEEHAEVEKDGVVDEGERGEDEEEERRQEEPREEEEEGDGSRAGVVSLAWIPGDPCSCAHAPGMVGEACRGWLRARAAASSSSHDEQSEKTDPQQPVGDAGARRADEDLTALALSACKDGALASPRQLPPLPARQVALMAATAGASHLARHSPPVGGGGGVRDNGSVEAPPSSSQPPPPVWQENKPQKRAVVTQVDLRNFQHFWLANVEKKLLMVAIPKVACTQIHALFLRMQGSAKWNSPYMQEIHYHKDMAKYKMSAMPNMTPERASSILNDPTWTKGVFLRDPAERLLSCFLDKIVQRKSYSVSIFKANNILSFEEFVALISSGAQARFRDLYPGAQLGLSPGSNPHWRPQLFFGLGRFLPYFDFIGDFKHVQAHSEALFRRAGLWEEFGASGWGPNGNAAFFQRTTVQDHATGSRDSKSLYYTPPLLASVREAYAPNDYKMLAGLGWWNNTTTP